jgi:glycyl-tRNA synthetase beta subunit
MRDARSGYQKSELRKFVDDAKSVESVATFFRERLEFYLKVRVLDDVVKAVLAADAEDVVDAVQRAGRSTSSHMPEFRRSARLQTHVEHSETGFGKGHCAGRSVRRCRIPQTKRKISQTTSTSMDQRSKLFARKSSEALCAVHGARTGGCVFRQVMVGRGLSAANRLALLRHY